MNEEVYEIKSKETGETIAVITMNYTLNCEALGGERMTLEEWAAKAREVLSHYTWVEVDDEEVSEGFKNDEVIELCDEYDNLKG